MFPDSIIAAGKFLTYVYTLKEVIDFYHSQSTSIYMCFMDASKAFDRVNHWTLFKKLIDRGTPLIFVRITMQWYTTQKACVRWGSALSDNFLITNGVCCVNRVRAQIRISWTSAHSPIAMA